MFLNDYGQVLSSGQQAMGPMLRICFSFLENDGLQSGRIFISVIVKFLFVCVK